MCSDYTPNFIPTFLQSIQKGQMNHGHGAGVYNFVILAKLKALKILILKRTWYKVTYLNTLHG
jgi:hypothetical protein